MENITASVVVRQLLSSGGRGKAPIQLPGSLSGDEGYGDDVFGSRLAAIGHNCIPALSCSGTRGSVIGGDLGVHAGGEGGGDGGEILPHRGQAHAGGRSWSNTWLDSNR